MVVLITGTDQNGVERTIMDRNEPEWTRTDWKGTLKMEQEITKVHLWELRITQVNEGEKEEDSMELSAIIKKVNMFQKKRDPFLALRKGQHPGSRKRNAR